MGIDGKYRILMSRQTVDELFEVLQRPKFKMTMDEIMRIISAIGRSSENVLVTSTLQVVDDDPDDDIIINTAYDGKADYIVSGDPDIKSLKNFEGIKIVTVDEMLKMIKSAQVH
jgi:uncharacterized protein